MMIGFSNPIWFYQKPVDFRKQIDGLALMISDQLGQNPASGQLFIFRNRQANKIKLLWWDDHGFWLCYKRTEKGCFKFPKDQTGSLELSKDQLLVLISGLDFTHQNYLKKLNPINFF
jgi:transposase